MIKLIGAFIVSLFLSNAAFADCQATVFLKDWKGGFSKIESGFDWCFERTQEWGLDTSDGWKERYCSFKTNYDSYGKASSYEFLFFHEDTIYTSKYSRSIFYTIDVDYGQRVFDGYAKTLEIKFSPSCGKNGGYKDY